MTRGEKSSVKMYELHQDKYQLNIRLNGPTFVVKKEFRGSDWNVHTNNAPAGISIKTGKKH